MESIKGPVRRCGALPDAEALVVGPPVELGSYHTQCLRHTRPLALPEVMSSSVGCVEPYVRCAVTDRVAQGPMRYVVRSAVVSVRVVVGVVLACWMVSRWA